MLKKKLAVVILGALMFSSAILPQNNFFPTSVVCAEVKTIEADGYYIMGDGTEENQATAKERARADAKRAASEQAGIFIESISEIKNGNLTRDEIRTISATVLEIIKAPVNPELSGGAVMYHCHITAKVDTANVDKLLQERQKNNQKFDEMVLQNNALRKENLRLNTEIEELKTKNKTTTAEERTKINAKIKRNEDNFTAMQWTEKGIEYYHSKKYDKAIECYNKAIGLNSKYDLAWYALGGTYLELDKLKPAIEHLSKAVELNPKNIYSRFALVIAYENSNNTSKALKYLDEAKNINFKDSKDYREWCIIGIGYWSIKNYENAVECFNKAINLNPNNENVYGLFAGLYVSQNNYNKVIEYTRKMISLNPNNAKSWSLIAAAYFEMHKYKKSLECIDKAIKLNPNNSDYKKFRSELLEEMG